jgi:hypothetical protein
MWCTLCQTFFDYRTGLVDNGRTHNPEYTDYLRRLRRDQPAAAAALGEGLGGGLDENLGMGCGDTLPRDILPSVGTALHWRAREEWTDFVLAQARRAAHTQSEYLPDFADGADPDGIKLQMRFLKSEIDEKHFQTQDLMRVNRLAKNKDIRDTLCMFVLVTRDILQGVLRSPANSVTAGELRTQFTELNATVKDRLETIGKTYKVGGNAYKNMIDFFTGCDA